ncbi:ArsR family transcriptional regulator [Halorubrum sp. AD140]|uniref:ArsR family transcriptional regulator n=1 Tax=Halorubrum sp. AD140 TaxID=3050073 RepID=UPI002ACCD594|nr:ArsR family transcriptional regulator [Halorubrum sp. AD140]MDZ5810506.1 ArsR family transcriptional regulator [Halorubrum sp. AD140]
MKPQSVETDTRSGVGDGPSAAEENATTSDEFDTWLALRKATDRTRANLIADIVGHPKGAPSVRELDYMNPDLGEDAIRRHLSVLQDVGVIEETVVKPGNRVRGYPYKFYLLTDHARALFDRNDLFPVDAWRRQYARVEKSGEITELEEMPRPD